MIKYWKLKKIFNQLTKAEGQAIKNPEENASPTVMQPPTSLTNSSLSRIDSSMRTSVNSAPNSIPPALVAGSVLRIVAYATFRLLGYVEVFRTTSEPTYIRISTY